MLVAGIRNIFLAKYKCGDYNGASLLEIVGASFEADEDAIFGNVSSEYVCKEIEWYNTQELNLNAMEPPVPKAWQSTACPQGYVNSNYGWCIYSKDNGYQYLNVLRKLQANIYTKRACMIYTRPTMHTDAVANCKNDFICTNAVTYSVANNKLNCVVQMRSNDAVYGYKNDLAWQKHVLAQLAKDLGIEVGKIIWQAASLHIYKTHFKLLRNN